MSSIDLIRLYSWNVREISKITYLLYSVVPATVAYSQNKNMKIQIVWKFAKLLWVVWTYR